MLKKYLLETLVAIGIVLAPIKAVMVTVGVLVVADFVLGLWAAKKRGESLSSSKMSRSVQKCLVYQLTVIVGFLVETYLMDGVLPVCKIVASLIAAVEFKSLLENSQAILGQPLFQTVISKLKVETEKELAPPPEEK